MLEYPSRRQRGSSLVLGLAVSCLVASSTFHSALAQSFFLDGTKIDKVVAFGDSLTDTGNFYRATNNTLPPPPYYQGRFSNGPLWIEYFANATGTAVTNYAFVGAVTGDGGKSTAAGIPAGNNDTIVDFLGLDGQVSQYLNATTSFAATTAHVVWIGGNDYPDLLAKQILTYSSDTATTQVTVNITRVLRKLYLAGARTFVVIGMPDLSQLPYVSFITQTYGQAASTLLKATLLDTSMQHNTKLLRLLSSFAIAPFGNGTAAPTGQQPTVKFVDVMSDPRVAAYQAQFLNGSCLTFAGSSLATSNISVCANPDKYFFWDVMHPTTKVHEIISTLFISQVNSTIKTNVAPTFTNSSTTTTISTGSGSSSPTPTKSAAAGRLGGWTAVLGAVVGAVLAIGV